MVHQSTVRLDTPEIFNKNKIMHGVCGSILILHNIIAHILFVGPTILFHMPYFSPTWRKKICSFSRQLEYKIGCLWESNTEVVTYIDAYLG